MCVCVCTCVCVCVCVCACRSLPIENVKYMHNKIKEEIRLGIRLIINNINYKDKKRICRMSLSQEIARSPVDLRISMSHVNIIRMSLSCH